MSQFFTILVIEYTLCSYIASFVPRVPPPERCVARCCTYNPRRKLKMHLQPLTTKEIVAMPNEAPVKDHSAVLFWKHIPTNTAPTTNNKARLLCRFGAVLLCSVDLYLLPRCSNSVVLESQTSVTYSPRRLRNSTKRVCYRNTKLSHVFWTCRRSRICVHLFLCKRRNVRQSFYTSQ